MFGPDSNQTSMLTRKRTLFSLSLPSPISHPPPSYFSNPATFLIMDHSYAPPYHHLLAVSMQNQHSHFAHPDLAVLPTYHHHYHHPTATSHPQRTPRNDQRPLPFQLALLPGPPGYADVSTAHPPPTLVETRSGEFITACINNCPICHEETQKVIRS